MERGTSQKLFVCKECGFHYRTKEWRDRCEAWCKAHQSCNLEITARAIENQPPQS